MLRLTLQLWHSFSNIPLLNCPYCSQLHVPVLHSIPSPPGLNVHIHLIIPSLTFSHRPCISFPDILHHLLLQSRTTHSYLLHFHMYSAQTPSSIVPYMVPAVFPAQFLFIAIILSWDTFGIQWGYGTILHYLFISSLHQLFVTWTCTNVPPYPGRTSVPLTTTYLHWFNPYAWQYAAPVWRHYRTIF